MLLMLEQECFVPNALIPCAAVVVEVVEPEGFVLVIAGWAIARVAGFEPGFDFLEG